MTVCRMIQCKVKITEVRKLWKWPISEYCLLCQYACNQKTMMNRGELWYSPRQKTKEWWVKWAVFYLYASISRKCIRVKTCPELYVDRKLHMHFQLAARQVHVISLWLSLCGGTAAAAPPPFRPGNPALCGSYPLVTPYYCRLGDLLCFVFIVSLLYFFC